MTQDNNPNNLPLVASLLDLSRFSSLSKCEIYQGPRTGHCNDCNACIDELDHHCPWMSKCVGKGNMIAFKYFNLSWVVYFLYAIFGLFN